MGGWGKAGQRKYNEIPERSLKSIWRGLKLFVHLYSFHLWLWFLLAERRSTAGKAQKARLSPTKYYSKNQSDNIYRFQKVLLIKIMKAHVNQFFVRTTSVSLRWCNVQDVIVYRLSWLQRLRRPGDYEWKRKFALLWHIAVVRHLHVIFHFVRTRKLLPTHRTWEHLPLRSLVVQKCMSLEAILVLESFLHVLLCTLGAFVDAVLNACIPEKIEAAHRHFRQGFSLVIRWVVLPSYSPSHRLLAGAALFRWEEWTVRRWLAADVLRVVIESIINEQMWAIIAIMLDPHRNIVSIFFLCNIIGEGFVLLRKLADYVNQISAIWRLGREVDLCSRFVQCFIVVKVVHLHGLRFGNQHAVWNEM